MSFLNRIFGGKKKAVEGESSSVIGMVDEAANNLVRLASLNLSVDVQPLAEGSILVSLQGADEELLVAKEGLLLDAVQLFLQRVVQHQLPDDRTNIEVDCSGYREQANAALIDLAEKLKDIALSKGKSVYFRALPPKDRKIIHQYLADDGRVRSRSVGDGHFKKIKIYPAKDEAASAEDSGQH